MSFETDKLDDLDDLLDDMGVSVTYDGDTIAAIFDGEYKEAVSGEGGIGIATSAPMLTCKTSDVSGAAVGDSFVVGGVTYYAMTIEPNEVLGQTIVRLSRDAV